MENKIFLALRKRNVENAIVFLLCLLILIFGISYFVLKFRFSEYSKNAKDRFEKIDRDNRIENSFVGDAFRNSLYFNSNLFPNIIIYNFNNQPIRISNLKARLFFWTMSRHCNECVNSSIMQWYDFRLNNNFQDFAVITNIENKRNISLILDKISPDIDVYFYKDEEELFKDQLNPFFFQLDSFMQIKSFYIPYKEYPKLTLEYFNILLKQINKSGI